MKKVLIVSTVSRQFYLFEEGNIEVLKKLDFEVHGAANFKDKNARMESIDIVQHDLKIERSPFSPINVIALIQLIKLMKQEKFDVIHCHSPMGGVLSRIAKRLTSKSKIIYTAHGFHFYKGAPIKNWLVYYPAEKILSRFTDIIITINKEDYKRSLNFKAGEVVYVPGIGINTEKFNKRNFNKLDKRKELNIPSDTKILLTIGELIERKNHETAIKSLTSLKDQNFVYLICGTGVLDESLKDLVKKLGYEDKVMFLGFRNDIPEICLMADVFVFPSNQEGLPVSIMEAMAAGLPIACSNIRGNIDLVDDGINGFTFSANNPQELANKLNLLLENKILREKMKENNQLKIKEFSKIKIQEKMEKIYLNTL